MRERKQGTPIDQRVTEEVREVIGEREESEMKVCFV